MLVRQEVTGSVAMKTAAKAKPPSKSWSTGQMYEAGYVGVAKVFTSQPVARPPAKTERIMRHDAMPVARSRIAPRRMQSVEVSPNEPGIRPRNACHVSIMEPSMPLRIISGPVCPTISPSGVAPENASGRGVP